MGNQSGGVELLCTAEGWFPEPHVRWEDRWGERLLAVSEHHVLGEDGLFRVEDMLVVGNVSVVTETVSCFIHNPVLEDGKGAVLNLPGQCAVGGLSDRPAGELGGAKQWLIFAIG